MDCYAEEFPERAGAPVGFLDMFILASFFLLREVEASLMIASSVFLDMLAMTVSIWLPTSKTDPRALTCRRRWGCVCGQGREGLLCAFHAACRQLERLKKLWPTGFPEGLPFFPTMQGVAVSKSMVVNMVLQFAAQLGLPLVAEDGRGAFTGHVFRISGSRHLARYGVDHNIIMLLARWASAVILQYLKDVPP